MGMIRHNLEFLGSRVVEAGGASMNEEGQDE